MPLSNRERFTYLYKNERGEVCIASHRRHMIHGIAAKCGTLTARSNRLNRSTRYNAPIVAL